MYMYIHVHVCTCTCMYNVMHFTQHSTCAVIIVCVSLKKGCDLIIALTHMRVPNDVRLATEVPEIHLILGGHDHHYEEKWVSVIRH